MKKLTKRIGALLMMCVMLLSLSMAASAAPGDLYDPDVPVSLTITKLLDNGTTVDATGKEVVGLPNTPVKDVKFTITYVADMDGNAAADQFMIAGTTDAAGKIVFNSISGATELDGETPYTGSHTKLPHGQYKVEEYADGYVLSSGPNPFNVNLPMTDPSALNEWIYNVYCYPKNTPLEIDKERTSEPSVQTGDYVDWTISATIPSDIAKAQNYAITDVLDSRLTIDAPQKNNVSVYYYDDEPTNSSKVTLVEGTHYNLTYTKDAVDDIYTLKIDFIDDTGFLKLDDALGDGATKVHVDLKTLVTILPDDDLGQIKNGASLEFKNENGHEYEVDVPDPEIPDVKISGIDITKVNESAEKLQGAEFILKRETVTPNVYEYFWYDSVTGKSGWIADYKTNTKAVFTTDSDGYVRIPGLEDGKYILQEIKAPAGYNLLKDVITVVIKGEDEKYTINGGADQTLVNGVVDQNIVNKKGFELPKTGGAGTILFTILGLGLMAGAVILFVLYCKNKRARA